MKRCLYFSSIFKLILTYSWNNWEIKNILCWKPLLNKLKLNLICKVPIKYTININKGRYLNKNKYNFSMNNWYVWSIIYCYSWCHENVSFSVYSFNLHYLCLVWFDNVEQGQQTIDQIWKLPLIVIQIIKL